MQETGLMEVLAAICAKDRRYDMEAYLFVREALDFTVKTLRKPTRGPSRHVTGKELLDGIRDFALQEYGPMARTLLRTWGVNRTEDFGELVFNLVSAGQLGKTEQDRREDFANGYDFTEAFEAPFLPASKRPAPAVAGKRAETRDDDRPGPENRSWR